MNLLYKLHYRLLSDLKKNPISHLGLVAVGIFLASTIIRVIIS